MMYRAQVIAVVLGIALTGFTLAGQSRVPKPVTDAMLLNPDPSDWLNFRRTLDGWGYSPLDQINKENVHQLQLQWSWGLLPGESEPTPLVSDGIMYVPNPGGGIHALDAATGDLLWEFRSAPVASRSGANAEAQQGVSTAPLPASAPSHNLLRNIAIYGDKVFTAVSGSRLVALNAATGAVVWNQQVGDPAKGFNYTAGPIIVKGKVVAGTAGCERYKDDACFISAHDAQTGKELWRTFTVARPGDPGGETWGDLPLMFRAGGDAWQAGSYDPQTDLIFWGTSQAKPWAAFQRGTEGDALYTNSTLALNPETGKMAWHFQHLPGEQNDMDETFERILIDYNGRSSVFSMGKIGVLWELDRKTGAFVNAHDLGYQTVVSHIDAKTGRVTYRPDALPRPGVEVQWCPSTAGFKSWRAMAYHPSTQAFYIPLNLSCQKGLFGPVARVAGGGGSGAVKRTNSFHPESPSGLGEFLAMDMKTGRVLWRYRSRTPINTAALTTGGGLVIAGDWDRHLLVFDAVNGKILFQTRLTTSVQGFPITYSVRGRQYLAVPVGTGGSSWSNGLPRGLTPEKKIAGGSNSIFVFALPERKLDAR